MQVVDFSFVSALAGRRIPPADFDLREALVAATADGESTTATSHHADLAYALQSAAAGRRRFHPGPPQQASCSTSAGGIELAWTED